MLTNALVRARRLVPGCALVLFANACADRGPLAVADSGAEVAPDHPDAGTPPSSVAGARVEVWFAQGLVADLDLTMGPSGDAPDGQRAVGDTFIAFIGYGVDIAYLGQAATVERPWDRTAPTTALALTFGGPRLLGGEPAPVAASGYALARAFYDAMTNARKQSTPSGTSRDSPGGRVHCELFATGDDASCYLTEVQQATFR